MPQLSFDILETFQTFQAFQQTFQAFQAFQTFRLLTVECVAVRVDDVLRILEQLAFLLVFGGA